MLNTIKESVSCLLQQLIMFKMTQIRDKGTGYGVINHKMWQNNKISFYKTKEIAYFMTIHL